MSATRHTAANVSASPHSPGSRIRSRYAAVDTPPPTASTASIDTPACSIEATVVVHSEVAEQSHSCATTATN